MAEPAPKRATRADLEALPAGGVGSEPMWRRRAWPRAMALLVGLVSVTGCGGRSACTPGASAACTCASGAAGAQVCLADGTFGACSCEAIDGGAGMDGGGDPRPDASTDAGGCGRCDDGVACTEDACDGTLCVHTVRHTRCTDGQICDATRDCIDGATCTDVSDCPPVDGCLLAACSRVTSLCRYTVVDRDMDGHTPRACGGDDCNDATAAVAPGRTERCNDSDEDCDDVLDEDLPDLECPSGLACIDGACGCAAPLTSCSLVGAGCVDLTSDDSHCAACGHSCAPGARCQEGQCQCADGTICGGIQGECTDAGCDCSVTVCAVAGGVDCVETLIDNPLHCGECGNRCALGEICFGTTCVTP